MMSMEHLSLIMIALVVAVAAAGGAYAALRVWGGRIVDSDHPDPRSSAARSARAEHAGNALSAVGPADRAHLEPRHERPVV